MAVFLTGCSSFNKAKEGVGEESSTSFGLVEVVDAKKGAAQLKAENQKNIEKELKSVLSFCQPRLSGYERKTASQASKAYWLSMSGLVAGTVIAPALTSANAAANASSIAALSGWAGATNFAGQALTSSGLSGSTIAKTRNDIISEVKENIEIATDSTKTFDQRRNALLKARSACIIYEIAVPSLPASG